MKHEEDDIQREIVRAFRLFYPQSIIFACPNGGSRNAREGANLKRSGVLAGVSDLIVIHNRKCLFIEVKKPKGKQTDNQLEFEEKVKQQGFEYHVVYSTNDLLKIIKINDYKQITTKN
jgi:hypothetical protein